MLAQIYLKNILELETEIQYKLKGVYIILEGELKIKYEIKQSESKNEEIKSPNLKSRRKAAKQTFHILKHKKKDIVGEDLLYAEKNSLFADLVPISAKFSSDCQLAFLSSEMAHILLRKEVKEYYKDVIQFLQRQQVFLKYDEEYLTDIAQLFQKVPFSKNSVIFQQGEAIRNYYLVMSGQFTSFMTEREEQQQQGGQKFELSVYSENQFFGMENIVQAAEIREYSVCCSSVTGTLLILSRENYSQLYQLVPDVQQDLRKIIEMAVNWKKKRLQALGHKAFSSHSASPVQSPFRRGAIHQQQQQASSPQMKESSPKGNPRASVFTGFFQSQQLQFQDQIEENDSDISGSRSSGSSDCERENRKKPKFFPRKPSSSLPPSLFQFQNGNNNSKKQIQPQGVGNQLRDPKQSVCFLKGKKTQLGLQLFDPEEQEQLHLLINSYQEVENQMNDSILVLSPTYSQEIDSLLNRSCNSSFKRKEWKAKSKYKNFSEALPPSPAKQPAGQNCSNNEGASGIVEAAGMDQSSINAINNSPSSDAITNQIWSLEKEFGFELKNKSDYDEIVLVNQEDQKRSKIQKSITALKKHQQSQQEVKSRNKDFFQKIDSKERFLEKLMMQIHSERLKRHSNLSASPSGSNSNCNVFTFADENKTDKFKDQKRMAFDPKNPMSWRGDVFKNLGKQNSEETKKEKQTSIAFDKLFQRTDFYSPKTELGLKYLQIQNKKCILFQEQQKKMQQQKASEFAQNQIIKENIQSRKEEEERQMCRYSPLQKKEKSLVVNKQKKTQKIGNSPLQLPTIDQCFDSLSKTKNIKMLNIENQQFQSNDGSFSEQFYEKDLNCQLNGEKVADLSLLRESFNQLQQQQLANDSSKTQQTQFEWMNNPRIRLFVQSHKIYQGEGAQEEGNQNNQNNNNTINISNNSGVLSSSFFNQKISQEVIGQQQQQQQNFKNKFPNSARPFQHQSASFINCNYFMTPRQQIIEQKLFQQQQQQQQKQNIKSFASLNRNNSLHQAEEYFLRKDFENLEKQNGSDDDYNLITSANHLKRLNIHRKVKSNVESYQQNQCKMQLNDCELSDSKSQLHNLQNINNSEGLQPKVSNGYTSMAVSSNKLYSPRQQSRFSQYSCNNNNTTTTSFNNHNINISGSNQNKGI